MTFKKRVHENSPKMSTRIHPNNVHENSPQKRNSPILSTKIHLLCPQEFCNPWLSDFDLGHFKLFITELLWKWNSIFFFAQCFAKFSFKITFNYYFLFFYNLKETKSNSLLTVKYALRPSLTELFPIYQNKHWTIWLRDDCSVDPS